jgi:hypothetical protein
VDAREVVVVHPMILFYLARGVLILDLKVLKGHLYYLWMDLTSFLLPDETEDHLSSEATLHFLVAQNHSVAAPKDPGTQDMVLEEDYQVFHTVNLGIHHKSLVVLQVLSARNDRIEVDRRMVAFAGLIQAFLHHTSCDAGEGPFLLVARYLEIVQDNHDQEHQDCQAVEFV